ncbi:hypothetical protein ACLOJK_018000 [Asimina triloba]
MANPNVVKPSCTPKNLSSLGPPNRFRAMEGSSSEPSPASSPDKRLDSVQTEYGYSSELVLVHPQKTPSFSFPSFVGIEIARDLSLVSALFFSLFVNFSFQMQALQKKMQDSGSLLQSNLPFKLENPKDRHELVRHDVRESALAGASVRSPSGPLHGLAFLQTDVIVLDLCCPSNGLENAQLSRGSGALERFFISLCNIEQEVGYLMHLDCLFFDLFCSLASRVARVCSNCGVTMGEYFCAVCKFYDDDSDEV